MDDKISDVRFTARCLGSPFCVCDACHATGVVTKIQYPLTKYHDGINLSTEYKHLWLCADCLLKLRESLRPPIRPYFWGDD